MGKLAHAKLIGFRSGGEVANAGLRIFQTNLSKSGVIQGRRFLKGARNGT